MRQAGDVTGDQETIDVRDEHDLKDALVRGLQSRVKEHESQHKCAKAWGVTQPVINYIVNARMDRLTVKQLLGIAWKSGAAISIGLNYAS